MDDSSVARFWAHVSEPNEYGCRLWTGPITGKMGYGSASMGKKKRTMAHRVAWSMVNGDIPRGMFVCHHCDVPTCCEPTHLFIGTHTDNMRDMHAKGRGAVGDSHGSHTMPGSRPRGESSHSSRLTDSDVRTIRSLRCEGWKIKDIANRFGITHQNVSQVAARKTWAHVE